MIPRFGQWGWMALSGLALRALVINAFYNKILWSFKSFWVPTFITLITYLTGWEVFCVLLDENLKRGVYAPHADTIVIPMAAYLKLMLWGLPVILLALLGSF